MSLEGRARFLAEFTLSTQSEILRCAQDDTEGLGMTALAYRLEDPGRMFPNWDAMQTCMATE